MSNHLSVAKKTKLLVIFLSIGLWSYADGGLNTYYKVGTYKGSMDEAVEMVKASLTTADNPFEILGDYQPAKADEMHVIAFTRKDLVDICLQYSDMSILASVLRIGLFQSKQGEVEVSLLNPDYLFYAYLRDRYEDNATELSAISIDVRVALFSIGHEFRPFGGAATDRELKSFQFTASMPGFDEPVELASFASFSAAVDQISVNLRSRRNGTLQVYQEVFPDKQVAVFGVALQDARMGEAHFLPILGEDHLANLPYEIVVVGNKALMLHGRFRLPLFWTNVSIRQHQRLYKTPRDIEEVMRSVTQP